MTDRILDIADRAVMLHVRYDQLIIEGADMEPASVPLEDLAVLAVSHPQVTYSHAVLAGLIAAGGAFVACDERHLPIGMLLALDAHYVQTERFAVQARAPKPLCKRLWQQLARSKISAQAALLMRLYGDDGGLPALVARVRSGDPANVEAQASRRYWQRLFGDAKFRRNRDADDVNRHLNYGYAVLRAIVARAIAAAGLHPSLGLHHHNRYNSFCLADDLMEPFRPMVDEAVVAVAVARGMDAPLDKEAKAAMLAALTGRVRVGDQSRTLFDAASAAAASLVGAFAGEGRKLELPEW